MMKDMAFSDKEIASQEARIQKVIDDPEKDEHDVKKQREVLQEYLDTVPREQEQLYKGYGELMALVETAKEDANEGLMATDEFNDAIDKLKEANPILIECGKLEADEKYPPEEDAEGATINPED